MRAQIKQARERIEALRIALTGSSPDEICAALPGLEEAARNLETVEQEIRGGACAPYEVRRELKLLKSDLHLSRRLIEQGAAFCQGWARLTGASPAYTQAGVSAPSEPLASLSVRG